MTWVFILLEREKGITPLRRKKQRESKSKTNLLIEPCNKKRGRLHYHAEALKTCHWHIFRARLFDFLAI